MTLRRVVSAQRIGPIFKGQGASDFPEESRFHQHRGGSLKSRFFFAFSFCTVSGRSWFGFNRWR
jgi:hypothetical protein